MIILEIDPKWSKISREDWLTACMRPGRGLLLPKLGPLLDELRSHFPQPGGTTHREMPVILRHRDKIDPHAHPEWLILYYPFTHDTPLVVSLHGKEIKYAPRGNSAVMLEPDTEHSVPQNERLEWRLSVALRWRQNETI